MELYGEVPVEYEGLRGAWVTRELGRRVEAASSCRSAIGTTRPREQGLIVGFDLDPAELWRCRPRH